MERRISAIIGAWSGILLGFILACAGTVIRSIELDFSLSSISFLVAGGICILLNCFGLIVANRALSKD